jgi:hypothetical protein
MAAAVSDVRRIASDFDSLSDNVVQGYLDDAAGELNEAVWGDLFPRAVALLACHELAAARPDLYRGNAIQSVRVGEVSTAFATPPISGRMATSRFGLTYQRLLDRLGLTPEVA